MDWGPSWIDGHLGLAAISDWQPSRIGGHLGLAAISEWRPPCIGSHLGLAAISDWRPAWIDCHLELAASLIVIRIFQNGYQTSFRLDLEVLPAKSDPNRLKTS